ncbi:MFS transporter [Salinicoccus albus]|uniref:MFS transporter n=1 Tax=Salinicoccus albus TaxID=418756 RepID=UPI00036D0B63|nr:MFS transporter [Salinicoccus albus]
MAKERLWTKDFIFVFIFNFLIMLAMFLLMVTISGYAVEAFGISTSLAGLVSGIFIVGSLAGRVLTGHQLNLIGARKIMYIGTVMFIVTYGLYFVADNLALLLIVRFFNGLSNGVATTAVGTIAALSLPQARRGEGISYFSLSFVIATALGPFMGFFLLQYIEYQILFLIVFILVSMGGVLTLFVKTDNETVDLEKEPKPKFEWIDKKAMPIGLVVLIICMAYSTVLSFMTLFSEAQNLVEASSYFFLVYAIVILLSRPITGRIMDQKGANVVMYPAFIVLAIGYLMLGLTSTGFMLLLSGVLIGFGYGNFQSISQALCIKLADAKNVGLATSTYFISLDFGLGVGSYVLGTLVPLLGYSGLYSSMFILVTIGGVIYFLVYGRYESNRV